jgi:lipid-A-disaccharide synthase
MLIAGEASGDLLAAELVQALREEIPRAEASSTWDYQPLQASLEPRFFGAGGPRMADAGVELAFDMTQHSVVGLTDVLKNLPKFRRLFHQLFDLAVERQPDAIIGVDFSGFNSRFARAIRHYVRSRQDWFHAWDPKMIHYVSPQVWASRETRVYQMERDYDLLLSILPFEKDWYAKRVPRLRVEFVGHPIIDRHQETDTAAARAPGLLSPSSPMILLLPGSRVKELKRHLPVLLGALDRMRAAIPTLKARLVLATDDLVSRAWTYALPSYLDVRTGDLAQSLAAADIALASTGTVTLECALFGVPTVAIYKASWADYQIARRIANVEHLALPNLLAKAEVFPEFIQDAATAENIARAGLELLQNEKRRVEVKKKLAAIVSQLGSPGASGRAAEAIVRLMERPRSAAYALPSHGS